MTRDGVLTLTLAGLAPLACIAHEWWLAGLCIVMATLMMPEAPPRG
jgi:hypothetical protein